MQIRKMKLQKDIFFVVHHFFTALTKKKRSIAHKREPGTVKDLSMELRSSLLNSAELKKQRTLTDRQTFQSDQANGF